MRVAPSRSQHVLSKLNSTQQANEKCFGTFVMKGLRQISKYEAGKLNIRVESQISWQIMAYGNKSHGIHGKVSLTSQYSTKRTSTGAHLHVHCLESVDGEPLMSVMRGQCDARPTVTFPAARHHRPLAGTKLYCLVTAARVCFKLAQGCTRQRRSQDSNPRHADRKSNVLTTQPPSHTTWQLPISAASRTFMT